MKKERTDESGSYLWEDNDLIGLPDSEILEAIESFFEDEAQAGCDAFDLLRAIKTALEQR